jgi:hypothetical protein
MTMAPPESAKSLPPPESTTTNVGHLAMDVEDTNLFDYGPIYV